MEVLAKRHPFIASAAGGSIIGVLVLFGANIGLALVAAACSAVFFWLIIRYFNDSM